MTTVLSMQFIPMNVPSVCLPVCFILSLSLIVQLAVLLPVCDCAIDFCESDPRVVVKHYNCRSQSIDHGTLLHQPSVNDNPFHGLHDQLWALSYFLHYCTNRQITTMITDDYVDKTACFQDTPRIWKKCVISALISAKMSNQIPASSFLQNHRATCYSKTVMFNGSHLPQDGLGPNSTVFRTLTWYGRGCAGISTCNPKVRTRSFRIDLSEERKKGTFCFLRDSVRKYVGLPTASEVDIRSMRVRILVYNRNDTTRRRWVNADAIVKELESDPRIEVRMMNRTPTSFAEQVKAYAWANILIAAHGAAMANTIVMDPGADIIEIWKDCKRDISFYRFLPHEWTGWQAPLLGHHIQYARCYVLNRSEIHNEVNKITDHYVDVNEIMKLVGDAVERQLFRKQDSARMIQLFTKSSNLSHALAMSFLIKFCCIGFIIIIFVLYAYRNMMRSMHTK